MSQFTKVLAVGFTAVFLAGCITDYGGRAGEQTEGEAKIWGKEIAAVGFDAPYDGTWSQTVKYNLRTQNRVTIQNYQNPVFASFSRDGLVDRDGDDVQGRSGTLGGKFNKGVTAVDHTPGAPCEFFGNITKDHTGGAGASFALCIFGFVEEIDKDLALQDAFASIDDMLKQIWAGTLAGAFQVELTTVTLNSTPITLTNALSIDVAHNGFRPINAAVDFSSPGGQELLQAILDNTIDGEATDIALGLNGGMGFGLPVFMTAAFDHASLRAALAG